MAPPTFMASGILPLPAACSYDCEEDTGQNSNPSTFFTLFLCNDALPSV